jgi:5'-3' exonuclease
MTLNGAQVGGVVGFMKTLRGVCNDVRPTKIYVVWEGGGSRRRRSLYPEYKMSRRPQKLNRFYDSEDIPDTVENHQWQVILLTRLFRNVPVIQIYVEDIEADDAIGYLARYKHRDDRKIFLTSDKDYYQLLDRKSIVYRPGRKEYVTFKSVKEEYGISCTNFALAKAVCGDPSDNIPGVQGCGFKTLAKRIPEFGNDDEMTIDFLLERCREQATKYAVLKRISESEEMIRRNWQLIYLDMAMLSASHVSAIDNAAAAQAQTQKIELMRSLMREGITDIDVDSFLLSMASVLFTPSE